MTKFVILLAMGLIVGCSNAAKKQTAETSAGPATATTPAVTAAATESAPAKDTKKTKATKVATTAAGDVTCTSGQDVRKLAIKGKDQGCELEYTKAGQASAVASQIVGQAKCDEVLTRIQDKLVAAGYKCE